MLLPPDAVSPSTFDQVIRAEFGVRSYFIRVALAVLSIFLLYHFGLLRFGELAGLYNHPQRLILATLLLLATIPLGAYRWHILLQCQGFRLAFAKTLQVVLVGQFFNTFLPGAYGGDIVRAGYIYHGARQQAGRLVLSIFVDRLCGMCGLVALAMVAQLALTPGVTLWATLALLALMIVGMLGIRLLPPIVRLIATGVKRVAAGLAGRLLALAGQLEASIDIYVSRKEVVGAALLLSVAQFAFALAAFVAISGAFDFVTVSDATIVQAGVISLVANSVPLTPGGIGIGEAAFANAVFLIAPQATGPYAVIFLACRALTLMLSLLGGLVFLVYRSEVIQYAEDARSNTASNV